MSNLAPKTHEIGYRAVLLREETKEKLREFRCGLPDRDLNQERRLVTAAIELVLSSPSLHKDWLDGVVEVVRKDLNHVQTA